MLHSHDELCQYEAEQSFRHIKMNCSVIGWIYFTKFSLRFGTRKKRIIESENLSPAGIYYYVEKNQVKFIKMVVIDISIYFRLLDEDCILRNSALYL